MGIWEIERKYRIPNEPSAMALLNSLRRARYHEHPQVIQRDEYYDNETGELTRLDYTVRLRETNGSCMIALKGPRVTSGSTYSRIELEFSGREPSMNRLELTKAGLDARVVIEKRRTTFVGQHVVIALDEVAQLGWFCEVEGASDDAIDETAVRFGLLGLDEVTQNYTELLRLRHGSLDGNLLAVFTGHHEGS